MLPPPTAATSQQISKPPLANSANGFQNSAQIQPQNQLPFANPNAFMGNVHGHPVPNMASSMFQPGLMNVPNNFVPLHNNSLGVPQFGSFQRPAQLGPGHAGFASQNNGCNMSSVAAFTAQGPFNMAPNVNQMNPCLPLPQFFGQNIPNLLQQLNQSMGMANGQFCLPYQNMNQHIPGQMLNMSQVPPHPSSHTSYGGPNQSGPMVLQNPAISGNQPFGANQVFHPVNQNSQNFMPQATGGNGSRPLLGSAPQLQGHSTMPFNSLTQQHQARNFQSPAFNGSQGNSSINDGGNRPNSSSTDLTHRNFKNSKKGFQKNQIHHMKNERKRFGFPGRQKGKGFQNERRNDFGVTSSTNQANNQKRSLSLSYTEQEIQHWREARRKNYPSVANIQKRLTEKRTDCTLVDREARVLRQELSEILAKQAELGVEVAEIPSEYLSYSENRDKRRRHDKRDSREEAENGSQHTEGPSNEKEKSRNRFNKRGRRDKRNRPKKKAKSEKHSSNPSSLKKREPTLLQKLLKTDIKRDKSQLLQALRFMVMNSFFKEWPNKPLMFPSVIVKENGCEINVVDDKSMSTGNHDKSMSTGNLSSQGTNNAMVERLGHDDDYAIRNGDHNNDSDDDNDDDFDNFEGDKIQILEEEEEEEEGEILE